ncbi:pyridoxamine 5'-phosphate oxidase family protein [Methanosphaerula subterraneus]|uniref:pyridoxamine 5'-phosphate oxidase family protein n=1 Tax=Methanosphaerula subterraneus TaxID=3350244 RepID=UPI003F85BE22
MREIVSLFQENPVVNRATVDDGKPRVRPVQFMLEESGRLYFCTANTKNMYRQFKDDPSVEICSISKEYATMRISGDGGFSDDRSIKERIIAGSDLVKSIYQKADNPIFDIFYIEHGTGNVVDSPGLPAQEREF